MTSWETDFNPRSREGSDVIGFLLCPYHSISIHAPARGATEVVKSAKLVCDISIHAPARGATCTEGRRVVYAQDFNPRSREGSDRKPDEQRMQKWLFQSTLPRGERRNISFRILGYPVFQSTLPRGERLSNRLICNIL